jgi:hypothetical protein
MEDDLVLGILKNKLGNFDLFQKAVLEYIDGKKENINALCIISMVWEDNRPGFFVPIGVLPWLTLMNDSAC